MIESENQLVFYFVCALIYKKCKTASIKQQDQPAENTVGLPVHTCLKTLHKTKMFFRSMSECFCISVSFDVRGRYGEGSLNLNKFKTKELGFRSGTTQNRPKFKQPQNVPLKNVQKIFMFSSIDCNLSHTTFRATVPPDTWSLTGVTQSGKLIRIIHVVTVVAYCTNGNPSYPLPY